MFLTRCQDHPNSYWMDKKSFDQLTANVAVQDIDPENRDVQMISNAKSLICGTCEGKSSCTGKCFGKPRAPELIQTSKKPLPETPLNNPGNTSVNELRESVTNKAGKETPLGSPAISFGDN